jgi:hypothetical protein
MRRDQLEHAIRTACQIIGRPEVIVVGSQAILGTFREDELPRQATMSGEIDIPRSPIATRKPCGSATLSKGLPESSRRSSSFRYARDGFAYVLMTKLSGCRDIQSMYPTSFRT